MKDKDIERYHPQMSYDNTACPYAYMGETHGGEYVKYSDYVELYNNRKATLLEAQKENKKLMEAGKAYQDLSTCYRIGEKPTEKLFDRLEKAKKALRGKGL